MENQDDNLIEELNKLNFSGKKGQNNRRMFIKECLLGGSQNIHTPYELCKEIIAKNKEICEKNGIIFEGQKFLVLFNVEFVEVLIFDFGISPENVYFIGDSLSEVAFVIRAYGLPFGENNDFENGNRICCNKIGPEFLETIMKKFSVVIGNPPYQSKSDAKNTKTQSIWEQFVVKSIELCKKDGYVALIHPSGWRGCGSAFQVARAIKEKQVEHLEIHSEADGMKTFGATTRYDWYVLKNCPASGLTNVVDQDKVASQVDLKNASFIPNSMIDKVFSFLAKDGEEKVEIFSNSAYHTQRDFMSETKHNEFIYPVVYSTPVAGPAIWYSSTNKNGHFGISKVILNPCRPIGFVIDEKGEYGMSQFCVGIVGDAKYLEMVASVIKNQKTNGFSEFMEACHFTDKIFNKDVISLLRKDFWKEFV